MAAPVARAVAPALSVVKRDAASLVGTDVDDDIDVVDVIDPDLFPIFEEEAAELLPQLGGALRQWAACPDNLGARSEVLRALHTSKAARGLAGAMRLGEMAHRPNLPLSRSTRRRSPSTKWSLCLRASTIWKQTSRLSAPMQVKTPAQV